MLRHLAIGISRVLFTVAVVFGVAAVALGWASVRILKRVVWIPPGEEGTREAMFQTLQALVKLANVLGLRPPKLEDLTRDDPSS